MRREWKQMSGLFLALFCLCLVLLVPSKGNATERSLTLEEVRLQALAHKAEIQNLQTKLELLEVNLAKAKADLEALSPTGKAKKLQTILKETGKIEAKQKRSKKRKIIELPPEVSLRFQTAALSDEINKTGHEVFNARLSAIVGAEQAYYDVLLENSKFAFWESREIETLLQLSAVRRQYLIGAASEADVALVENEYAKAQTEKAKAVLAAEAKKRILGEWIGKDVTIGFTFAEDSPNYKLTRDDLEPAVLFAKQHDMALFEAKQAQKQAEKDYTAVLGNKPSVYLQYEQEIKQYIFNEKKLSYVSFLKNYHKPELEAAKMWEGNYLLSWMFFQAEGPREWFQPAGISKEVAADRKAAIFALYLVQRQAEEHQKAALAALTAKVSTAYERAADIKKKRQEMSASLSRLEGTLDKLRKKQKLTGSEFGAIYQAEVQAAELQQELEENRRLYAKAASTFNLASGGFLSQPDATIKELPQTEGCAVEAEHKRR